MPKFRTLDDLDVRGKRVLLRADLNVPVKDGSVTDATRIERLAPTIETLIGNGARVIVMSHFGRPKGKRDPALSLRPLVGPLSRAIGGREVLFADDCIGVEAKRAIALLRPGQVALLENLRFHAEEEANSPEFARALADLGDVYVDDAFSAAHRAHASIDGLARLLPNAAGKLMQAELAALTAALERPRRPLLALIGGVKVSTKLDLLRFLIGKIDILVVGGAMANTFLFAADREIGRSLCERDMAASAIQTLTLAQERNCRVVLPEDVVVATAPEPGVAVRTVAVASVPSEMMILDVGPGTVAQITGLLEEARSLVWNGPLGAFETPPFDRATVAVAKKVGELTRAGRLLSVAGGGDTVAALAAAGMTDELSYVSTAGGAFLEWLEGRELPGVAALAASDKDRMRDCRPVM
jgi:phosphoglycerate kinase